MSTSLLDMHSLLQQYITPDRISQGVRVLLILLIGFPILKIITKVISKLIHNRLSPQAEMLIKRSVFYTGIMILLVSVLNELGFKLSALLGAAGIFGIAIGFASQTSVSNIISGIFLISERPFSIGDTIQVGTTVGEILSVDLLSVKLRTVDNRFVRIPNEDMIKTPIINVSRFDRRRLDLILKVSYKEDLGKVLAILTEIVNSNPLALKDPAMSVALDNLVAPMADISINIWCERANYGSLKHQILMSIVERFDKEGIVLPMPALHVEGNLQA